MPKWYETEEINNGIVISSRVRLARNLKKYPFPSFMTFENSKKAAEELKDYILAFPEHLSNNFKFISMNDSNQNEKLSMIENHAISPELANNKKYSAVVINEDETLSIMINEEDHIRIQSVTSGFDLEKVWNDADTSDNLIEEKVEYAFDESYGYLTSCPTNTGTGLRASVMVHIPMLEAADTLRMIVNQLSKFGMTIRGIYGEGSAPLGSIFQISNQVTLGKSEREIIDSLKSITEQIVAQEKQLRELYFSKTPLEFADSVNRSLGTLAYCSLISSSEAMKHLSNVWLGLSQGIISLNLKGKNIFAIMMNIQSGNLEKYISKDNNSKTRQEEKRAEFLNGIFKE